MVLELSVKKFIVENPDLIKRKGKWTCKKSPREVLIPAKESKVLLRFLGILHGDGNMSMNRILITEKNSTFANIILKLFDKVFGVKPNIFHDKNRNTYYCHIKNSILYRYLTTVLEVPKGALRKKLFLPSCLRELDKSFRAAYVGGLFDAEGWVTSRQAHIGLSITNEEIRNFISEILHQCNINHTTSERKRRRNNEFEIHIYGKENLRKFQEQISFTHPKKITMMSKFY